METIFEAPENETGKKWKTTFISIEAIVFPFVNLPVPLWHDRHSPLLLFLWVKRVSVARVFSRKSGVVRGPFTAQRHSATRRVVLVEMKNCPEDMKKTRARLREMKEIEGKVKYKRIRKGRRW